MALQTITGSVASVTGVAQAGQILTIIPVLRLATDGSGLVIGDTFTVTADGAGDVSFAVEPGSYVIRAQMSAGTFDTAMSVGTKGPYTFGGVIGAVPPEFGASVVAQAIAAMEAAEAARDLAQEEASNPENVPITGSSPVRYSALNYSAKAAADRAAALVSEQNSLIHENNALSAAIAAGAQIYADTTAMEAATVNGDLGLILLANGLQLHENIAGTATPITDGWIKLPDFRARDAFNAGIAASLIDGTVVVIAGITYLVDSTATGAASVANDIGVDGLLPFGDITPQHFGCPTDGVSDCQPATQRMADWVAAQTGAVGIQFPPNNTYVFNSQVRFDNPERTFMDLRGARIEWTFDGRLFDMNSAATDQLPITVTTDLYTKRDQYIYGGDFHYTGGTRTDAYAIQAFYMRGFWWDGFYVEGARGCAIFGAKDTYRFTNFRSFDCVRYLEVPEEGVLHAASLTGNDLIDVIIDGHISGPPTAEWAVYVGSRAMHFRVEGNVNGNFSAGHVKFKDGSVLAGRVYHVGFRSEQLESTRVAADFDDTRGTGFLTVEIGGGAAISGLNGWYGVNFRRCLGVYVGNCSFTDGSGGTVSTERAIYVDNNCRDVLINTESCQFSGIAAGREIVLESASARENITLLPEVQWLDSPLTVTGYNSVGAIPTKIELLDVQANISLPGNRVPKLPPKAWTITATFHENNGLGAAASVGSARLSIYQANDAGTGPVSSKEGMKIWTGGLPNLFQMVNTGAVRASNTGCLWVDVLTNDDNATVHLQVSGYHQ